MPYAKDANGNPIIDKESGKPIWCGSAASRHEHVVKELAECKEKLAYYENKYGRFETQEWKDSIKRSDEAFRQRGRDRT